MFINLYEPHFWMIECFNHFSIIWGIKPVKFYNLRGGQKSANTTIVILIAFEKSPHFYFLFFNYWIDVDLSINFSFCLGICYKHVFKRKWTRYEVAGVPARVWTILTILAI